MRRLLLSLALLGLLAGCGGAPEAVSPVYTDWSQLEPYAPPEPVYTEFSPYSGEALQPRDDYGPLLPYVGAYPETSSYMGPCPLLGLVTADGAIVTDPVYAQIQMAGNFWGSAPEYGRFLLLYRGELTGYETTEWGAYPVGAFALTVAAPDGSWVRELGQNYGSPQILEGGRLALTGQDGSALILNSDGTDGTYFPASALEPFLGEGFQWSWEGGPDLSWDGRYGWIWRYDENDPNGDGIVCWLDADTGAVTAERPADYVPTEYAYEEAPAIPGYDGYVTTLADPITGAVYHYARREDGSGADLLNADGNVVLAGREMPYLTLGIGDGFSPWVWADRIAYGEDGCFCYCDREGDLIFRYPVETNDD